MYVDPDKMAEEDYFPATKNVVNYKETSTPEPVPKHWLGFSYICSEGYELDLNFDLTEIKSKSDHSSNDKDKIFRGNILVIEGKWLSGMNLTDGATFPAALIKSAESRFNQKIYFPRDTK